VGPAGRHHAAAYGERYRDLIPGARLAVLDRCGHLPSLEQPHELARVIGGFLA
jgi:pimeloyl-ACP methyl ester carboxylesterase